MKQKDWLTLGAVAIVSVIISLVVTNMIFNSSSSRNQQVDVVPTISSSFPKPDPNYFNSSSIDPIQLITIGNGVNSSPFTQPTNQSNQG